MSKKLTRIAVILSLAVLLALPLAAKPPAGKGGGKGGDGEPSPQPPADPAIAFTKSDGELVVMNADGSNQSVILPDDVGRPVSLSWSPDIDDDPTNGFQGSLVFYRQFVENNSTRFDLWVIDVAVTETGVVGKNLRNLVPADTVNPAWSPQGDLIAFDGEVGDEAGIFLVPPIGGQPILIVPDPSDGIVQAPAWSPNGTHIAYRRKTNLGSSLIVKEVVDLEKGTLIDGPETVVISPEAGFTWIWSLDWSRSGSWIAFEGNGDELNDSIYVVDAASGMVAEVPSTKSARSPSWSPDDPLTEADETDMFLLYTESAGGGPPRYLIVRQDLATGDEVVVFDKKREFPDFVDWRRFPSVFLAP